jgi:hypothetical protein
MADYLPEPTDRKLLTVEEMQAAWFDGPAVPRSLKFRSFSIDVLCRTAHFSEPQAEES